MNFLAAPLELIPDLMKQLSRISSSKKDPSPHRAPAEVKLADVVGESVNHAAPHYLHHLTILHHKGLSPLRSSFIFEIMITSSASF